MNAKTRLASAIVLLCGSAPALALTETEANASIQFNFNSPGARSLAMGGAYLGLSADATAAYTNPAGLQALVKPEFSVEVRQNRFDTAFVSGGRAQLNPLDLSGVTYGSTSSDTTGVAFLSFARPIGDDAVIAFYRSELANFSNQFSAGAVDLTDPGRGSLRAVDSRIDLDIINYGVSGSWSINDQLSIGAGISYYQLDFDTVSSRFSSAGATSSFQTQAGTDHNFGINLGAYYLLMDGEHGSLTAGAVFRDGPHFKYDGFNNIILNASNQPAPRIDQFSDIGFDTPNVYGAGLAWQSESLVLTFDVVRVEYSSLADNLVSLLTNSADVLAPLQIDDGTEYRLGGEYTLEGKYSLRAGVWRDPEHTLRYDANRASDPANLSSLAVLFSAPADDEMHYSIGAGLIFESFQVDIAADFSEVVDTYSVSTVWRF